MPNERDIFNRLFLNKPNPMRVNDFVKEVVVLGLSTFYKYDQVLLAEKSFNRTLSADEVALIQLSDHRLSELEETVQISLSRHVDQVRPAPAFWYGIWQNIVAAFLYSFLLAIIAFTLAYNNIDPLKLIGIEIRIVQPASSG